MITPEVARDLSTLAISAYKEGLNNKIEEEVSNLIRRQANVGLFQCEVTATYLEIPPFSSHLELFDQLLKAKLTGFNVRRALSDTWVVSWSPGGQNDGDATKCRCCGKHHQPPHKRS